MTFFRETRLLAIKEIKIKMTIFRNIDEQKDAKISNLSARLEQAGGVPKSNLSILSQAGW
ncbi:MAG TPA: hypothetical protein VGI88_05265 [Verrucomicrobiae bacterium]|jgi:hypothetical protein